MKDELEYICTEFSIFQRIPILNHLWQLALVGMPTAEQLTQTQSLQRRRKTVHLHIM